MTLLFARSHDAPPRRSTGGLRCAGVFLNEVQPLDRHEELVLAGVAQLEELLHAVADADLLESDEHADAVVDVNDEVADLQIAQIRKECLGRRATPFGRASLLFEDVGFRIDLQAGVGKTEAARQRSDRDEHHRVARVFGALHRNGEDVVLLQQLDRALGSTRCGGDEQHGLARHRAAA